MGKWKFVMRCLPVVMLFYGASSYSSEACQKYLIGYENSYFGLVRCQVHTECGTQMFSEYFSASPTKHVVWNEIVFSCTTITSTVCEGDLPYLLKTPIYREECPKQVLFSGYCSGSECEAPSRNCSSKGGKFTVDSYGEYSCHKK